MQLGSQLRAIKTSTQHWKSVTIFRTRGRKAGSNLFSRWSGIITCKLKMDPTYLSLSKRTETVMVGWGAVQLCKRNKTLPDVLSKESTSGCIPAPGGFRSVLFLRVFFFFHWTRLESGGPTHTHTRVHTPLAHSSSGFHYTAGNLSPIIQYKVRARYTVKTNNAPALLI